MSERDRTQDLQVGSQALLPTGPPIPFYRTLRQPDLYAWHLDLTEQETAGPSSMADDCPVRLVVSSSSFDSFYDQYYWLVYNCQSNQFPLITVFIIGQLEP